VGTKTDLGRQASIERVTIEFAEQDIPHDQLSVTSFAEMNAVDDNMQNIIREEFTNFFQDVFEFDQSKNPGSRDVKIQQKLDTEKIERQNRVVSCCSKS
jgi:hypothetical protein